MNSFTNDPSSGSASSSGSAPSALSAPAPVVPVASWRACLRAIAVRAGVWLPRLALFGILAAYGAIQWRDFTPGSREVDSDGYLFLAERFACGLPPGDPRDDPYAYWSHVWVDAKDGAVIPKYTPGYPLLMALAWQLAGPVGPFLVSPVCGLLTLVAAWLLFRMWMPAYLAVLGVAVLAFGNMYVFYTNYVLAHAASMCLVTWGMYCLWRWRAIVGFGCATAAGLFLAGAVTVRPSNALLVFPMAVAVGHRLFSSGGARRPAPVRRRVLTVFAMGAGFSVVMAAFAYYNWRWFGCPLTTGYALSEEQSAFVLKGLFANVERMLRGFLQTMPAPAVAFGFFGLMACRGHVERLMRVGWVVPMLVLYAAYYWSELAGGAAVQRFLLCALPVLIGSAFSLIGTLRLSACNRFVLALLLAGVTLYTESGNHTRLFSRWALPSSRQADVKAGGKAIAVLEEGTAVFVHGASLHKMGIGRRLRVYHWNDIDAALRLRSIQNPGRGAPRQQPSRRRRLMTFFRSEEPDPVVLRRRLIREHLDAGRAVALIVAVRHADQVTQELGADFEVEQILFWQMDELTGGRRPVDGDTYRTGMTGAWGVYSVRRQ